VNGPFLFDTDVLVDYLRGQPQAVALVKGCADRIVLSAVVVAELYAGVRDDAELKQLDRFVALFTVVAVDARIAKAAGLYKRDYHKSHALGLADAILAATVDTCQATLKTLNVRHYPMFKGLKPAYAKK
jgi:predicted nucleic acid-binding protein